MNPGRARRHGEGAAGGLAVEAAAPLHGGPHGNVRAVAGPGDEGIVLLDTGVGGGGRLRQLDLALAQAGFGIEDVDRSSPVDSSLEAASAHR